MACGSRVARAAGLLLVLGTWPGTTAEGRAAGDPGFIAITPTNGQEVEPDLSDPGLDGSIRILLGHRLRPWQRRLLRGDSRGSFDGFGGPVSLLSQDFARVSADPEYDRQAGTITLRPDLPLPAGHYTLTVDGRLLDGGRRGRGVPFDGATGDFRTSFTVGRDVYSPRIRETTPVAHQSEVPPFAPISIVFNESLDPATAILGQSVRVEDAGVDPPLPVEGTLKLDGDRFVLVFVPDPCAGYPPATTIRVRILGAGNAEAVRDAVGNEFVGEPADGGVLDFEFRTRGEAPLPDPRLTPPPAQALYATTADAVVAFDLRGAIAEDGSFHPESIRQVLASEGYGGDFAAHLGSPGDAVVDPRTDPETGHSFLYLVDEEAGDVAVVETGRGRVAGLLGGFQRPRGLGIHGPDEGGTESVLLVSDEFDWADFGRGSLTRMKLGYPPGTVSCPVTRDDVGFTMRERVPTLRPPAGVAATPLPLSEGSGIHGVLVATEEDWLGETGFGLYYDMPWTILSQQIWVESPARSASEAVWGARVPVDPVCWFTGRSGVQGDSGLVSLARLERCGTWDECLDIKATQIDWIQDPGKPCVVPGTARCLVPNRAGGTVAVLDVDGPNDRAIRLVGVRAVGAGPTSVATDPTGRLAFVSVAGEGKIAVLDLADPGALPYRISLPGVRSVFTVATQ